MDKLIIGLVFFIGIHSVAIVASAWRDSFAARHGAAWKALYALVALAGVVLMSKGYAEVRLQPTLLYLPPVWLRHLAALLMLPVFILFLAPYFPGRIKSAMKHPQLAALKLWAVSHLLVNGTLGDVILFGSLLAWAVVEVISLKKREQRALPGAPPARANDVILVVLGLVSYVVFVKGLHQAWIGVAPFA